MFMSTSMCYWKSHRKKGKGEKEEDKYRWQEKNRDVGPFNDDNNNSNNNGRRQSAK